ncbi:MAG: alkaline phosphatase family protein, partial [Polyangiaceae bacterium]|nr:alkaline phosphatase family protein [Polyangiaceae bacterium]
MAALAVAWGACARPSSEARREETTADVSGRAPRQSSPEAGDSPRERPAPRHTVILFVWDGLRPDSITREDTPALAELQATGSRFSRHHAIYPSFTMVNAAGFATGAYPAEHAYFGNTIYVADGFLAGGDDSAGRPIPWNQPVFTEDGALLRQLDAHYRERGQRGLLLVETLFERAQAAGLQTATVGKVGPAALQDLPRRGVVVDSRQVWPLDVARGIQASLGLPPTAARAFDAGRLPATDGGNPVAEGARVTLSDGVTPDPEDDAGSPYTEVSHWLARAFVDYVLPVERPDLAVLWLPNPDSTEHLYGPGTPNSRDALRATDRELGHLEDKLAELGIADTTDLIVASDHGHSTVSGPQTLFPLRPLTRSKPREVDVTRLDPEGHSVSGAVRLADLMRHANPRFQAFDGNECVRDPVLTGIDRSGRMLYETASCTTPGYLVPSAPGQLDRDAVVVADNGGTEYVYVPSHDDTLIGRIVRFLQSRPEIGPIFVARRAGDAAPWPGTLPLAAVGLQDEAGRAPDVVASFAWNDRAVVAGLRGTEFESSRAAQRGMHGSFGPTDIRNVLVARGPSFARAFVDARPTGNVDVAPTIAHLLGLELPRARGWCIAEALVDACGGQTVQPAEPSVLVPDSPATHVDVASLADPIGPPSARGREYVSRVSTQRV